MLIDLELAYTPNHLVLQVGIYHDHKNAISTLSLASISQYYV